MLAVYLEQLSNMEGPDAEAAMCGALEALDVLDNATALERVSGWGLQEVYASMLC